MKILLALIIAMTSSSLLAQDEDLPQVVNGKKVIYTYKQYEKFDFDDLNIEGDSGLPGELSISPIHEKTFKNRLPYRKSFTLEIKKGVERVR